MDTIGKWDIRGRSTNGCGYIRCKVPDHPQASKHGGYVYEHRLVMEAELGRYLRPNEHVHHLNEDKSDNRIENLEVVTDSVHCREHKSTGITWAVLRCPSCEAIFIRRRRQTHLVKPNKHTYCSRSCAGSGGSIEGDHVVGVFRGTHRYKDSLVTECDTSGSAPEKEAALGSRNGSRSVA